MCILPLISKYALCPSTEILLQEAICHCQKRPRGVGCQQTHTLGLIEDNKQDSSFTGHELGYCQDSFKSTATVGPDIAVAPLIYLLDAQPVATWFRKKHGRPWVPALPSFHPPMVPRRCQESPPFIHLEFTARKPVMHHIWRLRQNQRIVTKH